MKNYYTLIKQNLLNIALVLILFNASKTFIVRDFYVRGIFIDIYSPVIFTSYLAVILLCISYINLLKKRDLYIISSLIVLFLINILFSSNPLFSIVYTLKTFFYIPFTFILIRSHSKINYKLVIFINTVYLVVFLFQFLLRQSVFPFLPFGFYEYYGLKSGLDFINLFGNKVVTPIANFPHANVFAAFLSFLNIFHLKKSSAIFFINIFVITILGSFSALLFNLLLFIFYSKETSYKKYAKILFYIFFVVLITFFILFQFKSVSVIERLNQLKISVFLFLKHPIFGVGASTFIYSITSFEEVKKRIYVLQPVHNIFILYLVEYGVLGISFIFYWVSKYKKYLKITPFFLFLFIFSLFDHFFLTLNQGLLLASLTICLHKSIIISNA